MPRFHQSPGRGSAPQERPAPASGFRHLAARHGQHEPSGDSEIHSLSDWFDHLPEPDWHKVGDHLLALPGQVGRRVSAAAAERRRKAAERAARREREAAEREAAEQAAALEAAHPGAAAQEARDRATTRALQVRALQEHVLQDRALHNRSTQVPPLQADQAQVPPAQARPLQAAARDAEAARIQAEALAARRQEARLAAAEKAALAAVLARQAERARQAEQSEQAHEAERALPANAGRPDIADGTAEAEQLGVLVERAREAIVAAQAEEASIPAPQPEESRSLWTEEQADPVYIPPYNLPSTEPDPEETPLDERRRRVVAASAGLAFLLGLLGLGAFGGGSLHTSPGGVFAPDFSLLSPARGALLIWPVVFLGMGAMAWFQWQPGQRSSLRQRSVGYPAAAATLLGGVWMVSARAGLVFLALLAAAAATGALGYCLRRLNDRTARTPRERLGMDVPIALYLGWMLTVLPWTLGVWATKLGLPVVLGDSLWAAVTLVVAAWAALTFALSERSRMAVATGFAWGLFWILGQRLLGDQRSTVVAITASMCAFVVLLATENRRYQITHAERLAARRQANALRD
ncbi:hypothetical protein GCM10023081_15990 [Arthrobacter ginkgonis]|uniref:Uncharacterized protein n=2 Tax=Arthrobacter ginkgonis TaxID=1630594 RepID=A0ABP7C5Y7_9MICC